MFTINIRKQRHHSQIIAINSFDNSTFLSIKLQYNAIDVTLQNIVIK